MYRTERISKEGLKHLITLYRAAFGKTVSLAFLTQKFDTGVFGASYIGYLAFDENTMEPAAYYGVFPLTVSHQGKQVLTAQSGDTMTHPDHQGKGLFTTLAKLTYELARKEGVQLVWGFPNKNSYPGFTKKLNWADNGNLIKYCIKVKTLPVSKLVHYLNREGLNNLYARFCAWFLSSGKLKNFEKESEKFPAVIEKSKAFYQYKKYFTQRFIIGSKEANAWVKPESSLQIGDMYFADPAGIPAFFAMLRRRCFWIGISEITFICSPLYPYNKALEQLPGATKSDSLPFCHLAGWDDELPAQMAICQADMDTF